MDTLEGIIVKGIAGFYYVDTVHESGLSSEGPLNMVYECKAKGIFRKDKIKPLVGDRVSIEVIDEEKRIGNIVAIHDRKSELIRPALANVDRMLLVFAPANPDPNRNLIDRFLILMERQNMEVVLCINKCDLNDNGVVESILKDYSEIAGYRTFVVSALTNEGIPELKEFLKGSVTALAGPSGVGKSSLLNAIVPEACMQTNEISSKIKRGRHTTRHSEIFALDEPDSFILDTPGFSSISLDEILPEELELYFPEMEGCLGKCRFTGCNHLNVKGCEVSKALSEHKIAESRFADYELFYQELKDIRRY